MATLKNRLFTVRISTLKKKKIELPLPDCVAFWTGLSGVNFQRAFAFGKITEGMKCGVEVCGVFPDVSAE